MELVKSLVLWSHHGLRIIGIVPAGNNFWLGLIVLSLVIVLDLLADLSDLFDCLRTVHEWHVVVHDDDSVGLDQPVGLYAKVHSILIHCDCFFTVVSLIDLLHLASDSAHRLKLRLKSDQVHSIVVNDENACVPLERWHRVLALWLISAGEIHLRVINIYLFGLNSSR